MALLVAAAALALVVTAQADAHPLGNFTVNSYLRVEASGGQLYLRQVVDMAEIPTFRERGAVDGAGGLEPYAAARAAERAGEIALTVDGRRLAVEPLSQTAGYRPGAGGLRVLRYAAWYTGGGRRRHRRHARRCRGRPDLPRPARLARAGHPLVERGARSATRRPAPRTSRTSCAPIPAGCSRTRST